MKKVLSTVLCILLILTACISVLAEEGALEESMIGDPERVSEIIELREKNSDTYLLSDGTYECVVYSENKYYETESGELARIDNSLIHSEYKRGDSIYKYANAANSTKVYFSETQPRILIASGKKELSFSLMDAKEGRGKIGEKESAYRFEDFDLHADNCITYKDVRESTDIIYSVNGGIVKECGATNTTLR